MTFNFRLPEKINYSIILLIAVVLFVLQMLAGSDFLFSSLIFLFVVISLSTVNLLGGLRNINGFSVFMLALKLVILSQFFKVYFWQPADSFLLVPEITAGVILLGFSSIFIAAWVTGRIDFRNIIIKPILSSQQLLRMGIIAFLIGTISVAYNYFSGFDPETADIRAGGLIGVARQMGILLPFSIVCATAYKIISSNYRKSFGLIVLIPMLTEFAFGISVGSKQIAFESVFYYFLTCLAFRYPFRIKHLAAGFFSALLAIMVLYPLAQLTKDIFDRMRESPVARTSIFLDAIFRLDYEGLSNLYEKYAEEDETTYQYYGTNNEILNRFSLIWMADQLIAVTIDKGEEGWTTITHGFKMILPRFIYPDKPNYNTGNYLGQKIGMVWVGDQTTQISFGLIPESFCCFSWIGVMLIPFILTLLFFIVYNKLVGSIEYNIWAIFLAGRFQHNFVEETISGWLLMVVQLPLIILALYYVFTKLSSISGKIRVVKNQSSGIT